MRTSIEKILQPVLWDYDINSLDFYHVAVGALERVASFDQQRAFIRILERLGWYDILELFGIQFVKEHLSLAGWSSETRQRARNAVIGQQCGAGSFVLAAII
ncbi:hypothetical protein JW998_14680 [candidate division KSB1 bacterium]|nr:hypothetical protein [candidate division KSB1 bacterium]